MSEHQNFTLKSFVPRYSFYPLYSHWPKNLSLTDRTLVSKMYYHEMENSENCLVYIHIPYCQELCNFCGLNVKITNSKNEIDSFVDILIKEIMSSPRPKKVKAVSIGGGTPNILPASELKKLFSFLYRHFGLNNETHLHMEIDPRFISDEQLKVLKDYNVKDLTIGLIDLDKEVLSLSNRHHGPDQRIGFELILNKNLFSCTIELIAGLALQTKETIKSTLDYCIERSVKSFNIYPLFIAPWNPNSKIHLKFNKDNFSENRFELFKFTCDYLKSHNYQAIGPGQFASSEHWWSLKLKENILSYNISGLFPFYVDHLHSFGPSAISSSKNAVYINENVADKYLSLVEKRDDSHSNYFFKSPSQIEFHKLIDDLFKYSSATLPLYIFKSELFMPNKNTIIQLELAQFENNLIKMTSLGRENFGHLLHLLDI